MQEYKSPWGEDAITELIKKGMSGVKPAPKQPPPSAPPTPAAETRSPSPKREKSKDKSRSKSRKKRDRSRSKSRRKKDRSRSKSRRKSDRSRSRGKKDRSRSKGKKADRSRSKKRDRDRSRSKKRDRSRSRSHKRSSRRHRSSRSRSPRRRSKSRSQHRHSKRSKSRSRDKDSHDHRKRRSPSEDDKRRKRSEKEEEEEEEMYEPDAAKSSSSEDEEEEEQEEGQEESIDPVPECPNTENKYHRCTAWCAKHWKAVKLAEALPAPEPLPVLPMPRRGVPAISAVGSCSDKGMRSVNEDMLWVIPSFKVPGQSLTPHPLCFLGVFDGHSGSGTVNYVYKAVQAFLKLHLGKGASMEEALFAAFKDTNANVLKDGTGRMWTANCGDSRAILSQAGKPIQLTRDHKVSDPEEQKRLQMLGAEFVESNGAMYVKYHKVDVRLGLSVARSLGDHHFNDEKDIISGTPDLTARMLTSQDDFIIVACDGLWDVLDNQAAIDFVSNAMKEKKETLDQIAAALAKRATSLGSSDNISVIIAKI